MNLGLLFWIEKSEIFYFFMECEVAFACGSTVGGEHYDL